MANHGHVRFPWAVPPKLLALYTEEMMKTIFNGFLVHQDQVEDPENFKGISVIANEETSLRFVPVSGGKESGYTTQVWSDGPLHLEMRHGPHGLMSVGQALEFRSLAASFGCSIFWDDGNHALKKPGSVALLDYRTYNDGLSDGGFGNMFVGLLKGKKLFTQNKDQNEDIVKAVSWGLWGDNLSTAKTLLDPIFFKSPPVTIETYYKLDRDSESFKQMRREDTYHWGLKFNWGALVDEKFKETPLTKSEANAALLPSAAIGMPCSKLALKTASVTGLERALAVSLIWANPVEAKELYEMLATKSKDLSASEAQIEKTVNTLILKAEKANTHSSQVQPDTERRECAKVLLESLMLSHQVTAAKSLQGVSKKSAKMAKTQAEPDPAADLPMMPKAKKKTL